MSFFLADIRAECPALMLAFLSLTLPQAVCVYRERTEGHVCAPPRVCVCLFDWLTSLIWTIKSVPVLRHEGYDGWSFTSQHLLPPPPVPLTTSTLKEKRKNADVLGLFLLFDSAHPPCFITLPGSEEGQWEGSARGSLLWGSKPGEGRESLWRLFCSHGSVSERTPMQLRQLALNPPTHTHTHTTSSKLLNWLHTCVLYSPSFFLACFMYCIMYVCLTASNDAEHWEEWGEAQLPLVRCRCHIGSVRPMHRQAGWQTAAHSRGNDTALLLWERLTERERGEMRYRGVRALLASAVLWLSVLL